MVEKDGLYPEDVMPPVYSVIEKHGNGGDMLTEVIIDGECATFEIPLAVYRAGLRLKGSF